MDVIVEMLGCICLGTFVLVVVIIAWLGLRYPKGNTKVRRDIFWDDMKDLED